MGEKNDYKVIHETIVPKKGTGLKKAAGKVALILGAALLFGLVERAVFEYSGKLLFHGQKQKEEKKAVELVVNKEAEETNEAKKEPLKVKPSPPPKTIVHKDIKVVEKKIDAGLRDYSDIMREFGKVAEAGNKSVVEIQSVVIEKDWFENPLETVTKTAGFIMAKQEKTAYILAKYSEIKKAGAIRLRFEGDIVLDGTIKNFNKSLDLAIISADLSVLGEEERENLPVVNIPSDEYISIGRPVMALGNPDGNLKSVLFGTVVNVEGNWYQPDYVFRTFYTDIKPLKNSFSLIMDTEGRALGISLPGKEEGSTRVVVTGRIVKLIENLINDVPSPYLGLQTKVFEGAEGKTGMDRGILVETVVKASPADKAGFREGDIIYAVGGRQILTTDDYSEVIESRKVGELVKFRVYRVTRNVGSEIELEAIIGDSRGVK